MDDFRYPSYFELQKRVVETFKDPGNLAVMLAEIWRLKTPTSKMSVNNQILLVLEGTRDARGPDQWIEAGHRVKKGAKKLFITVPVKKSNMSGEDKGSLEFKSVLVYRIEDTLKWTGVVWEEAKVVDYEHVPLPDICARAEIFGMKAESTDNGFKHKLANTILRRVYGNEFKGLPLWRKEAVAELSASVLGILYKTDTATLSKVSYNYIAGFAEGENPNKLMLGVLKDTHRVLKEILPIPQTQGEKNKNE